MGEPDFEGAAGDGVDTVVVAFDVWVWAGLTPEVRSQVWKTACQKVVVPGGGLHEDGNIRS
jgi:hypothetical protein